MVSPDLNTVHTELSGRLQKLMFLRVIFVSLLLGASIFLQVKETRTYFGDIQTSHYFLIATIYFLTFVYIVLFKYQRNFAKLAYIQLLVDTLVVTAIIYATGGMESIFSFLYILTIINGSILLYRKGGLIMASSSSILYGLLIDLHYYQVIHPFGGRMLFPPEFQFGYVFYMILVNTVAFYLVAFLSSFLSEQARKSRVELRAKQDDIVKLEALNERIIQSITSGLMTLDGQKRVILFNPAAEDIFGIRSIEAIGRRLMDVLPFLESYLREDIEGQDSDIRRSRSFIDLPYERPDGKKMFLRFSLSPLSLPDAGQRGQILFVQDMTEMKQIEGEMKRVEGLAMVGELAAGIAHEIRNPMASISGSIQMLREGLKRDDVNSRLMDIILREINRLNHLVSDFLLFARPKPSNISDFDLQRLITEALELIRNSGKWIDKVVVETDFQTAVSIRSDPEQVRQVLWNLFLNACEAMPEGGVLRIASRLVNPSSDPDQEKKEVKITIRDTGGGFSEQALSHIFKPFYTTKEGGSGLGLATVKRIVDGLKGRVEGKNHADGGAEISIYLRSASPIP